MYLPICTHLCIGYLVKQSSLFIQFSTVPIQFLRKEVLSGKPALIYLKPSPHSQINKWGLDSFHLASYKMTAFNCETTEGKEIGELEITVLKNHCLVIET